MLKPLKITPSIAFNIFRSFHLIDFLQLGIDNLHDKVVIVPRFPRFEDNVGVIEEVVLDSLIVINLFYNLVQLLVYVGRLGHWVLRHHVLEYSVFNVPIHYFEGLGGEGVLLGEESDVSDDIFTAEDLRLVESHSLVAVLLESQGKGLAANFGKPTL